MTNRKWLLNEMKNMSDEELAKLLSDSARICMIIAKPNKRCESNCRRCVETWLKAEHKEKITLSEAERIILENIDKDYKWICRDEINDNLYIYVEKPIKNTRWWSNICDSKVGMKLNIFNHLFQFIKWEDTEAYNIQELLKQ